MALLRTPRTVRRERIADGVTLRQFTDFYCDPVLKHDAFNRGSMRRIRAAHLLRALLRERRTRRRYSTGKRSSCSNNFSNGGSARRTCRKGSTGECYSVKPSTRRRRRLLVLRHAASSLRPGASRLALEAFLQRCSFGAITTNCKKDIVSFFVII
jgi:hypothetical protein